MSLDTLMTMARVTCNAIESESRRISIVWSAAFVTLLIPATNLITLAFTVMEHSSVHKPSPDHPSGDGHRMHLTRPGRIRESDGGSQPRQHRYQGRGDGQRYDECKEQLHMIPSAFPSRLASVWLKAANPRRVEAAC
jgi:hypothetical protein